MQKKTEKKTRTDGRKGGNILWLILSVMLALLIWIYYSNNFGTEMTRTFYGVEVTYVGRDAMRDSQSLIVSREETTSVTLKLSGSRRDIAKLTSEDLKAVVNLSTVTSAGYRTMAYTVSYPSSVNSSNIREEKSPQTVGLQISKLATRIVDVKGRFEGTLADGYALDAAGMSFDPAYVTLFGPEEELEQVSSANVIVDRDSVNSSFTAAANFNLVNADGETLSFDDVTMDVDTVTVTVPINMAKEVALDVSLIEGGGATEQNVAKKIEPESIILAGDASTLESINTIYIATIDLSDYVTFPQTEYPIMIPNDVDNLSGVNSATVDLSFSGLETAYYVVTNLEYVGLEEGYTADVMDITLGVTIRAPADVLANIEANNIRAVADLTGITTTSRSPVTVYVDGYPEAGAVGDYVLYVRVSPAAASEEADVIDTEAEAEESEETAGE